MKKESRVNVPFEQYDATQLYAAKHLAEMFGKMARYLPSPVAEAVSMAITPRQVRCIVREWREKKKITYIPPFTIDLSL